MRKRGLVAEFAAFILLPLFTAQACGPDFFPDVFVRKMRPDNPKQFAEGKLGILQPTYPREDLTVAFRYLNGGALSVEEQAGYQPTYTYTDAEWQQQWDAAQPKPGSDSAEAWQAARAKYAALAPKVEQDSVQKVTQPGGWTMETSYLNCNGNAFQTASLTLQSRAKTWGDNSAELADWIKGQDAVFANCPGGVSVMPAAAPAQSSALLHADRAYQLAGAQFYAGKFDDARQGFEAIAQDTASPWHGLGGYLAARCLIRQAFLSAKPAPGSDQAGYDPGLMRQAAELLEAQLKQPTPGISKQAVQRELNLVLIRIEPQPRLRELSKALAGPGTDPNYAQNLKDLTWYLNTQFDGKALRSDVSQWSILKQDQMNQATEAKANAMAEAFSQTWKDSSAVRSSAPLVDWLLTFQSPAPEATEHAQAEWRSTHELYWLVAAISKVTEKNAGAAELVVAAAAVKPDSAAWQSLTYHRARLLLDLDQPEEARALLDAALPKVQAAGMDSSINAFEGLRMLAAASMDEFLKYAPRKILSRGSESSSSLDECINVMKDPKRKYDCVKDVLPEQLSGDAAGVFNAQAPLSVWAEAATSAVLPEQLRQAIAMSGWVRSVLLKDDIAAAKFVPLLPAKLRQQAGDGTGFRALMTLVRNPGLRPYLDSGVQRSYSYDFVESYRDNWWCGDWQASWAGDPAPMERESAALLSTAQQTEGRKQAAELARQPSAALYLGPQVLEYANNHPNDPDVPESLYLVLRMIRYGCSSAPYADDAAAKENQQKEDALKKAAARLLRQRYADSPWTKKAAPIAG